MARIYCFTEKQLRDMLKETIGMMIEYRDVHGHDEQIALFAAVSETLQGLEADLELYENEPHEKLLLQVDPRQVQA